MKNLIILAVLSLTLTGCFGRWTKKTCTETSFSDLGYQEGTLGLESNARGYNLACLKKDIQIPVSDYNLGYQKGLRAYCNGDKGYREGAEGKPITEICVSIDTYTEKHREGLTKYCSLKRGVEDGFTMAPANLICTSFSNYNIGYKQGKEDFCTHERGHEDAFNSSERDQRCSGFSTYEKGYIDGKNSYCSPENGELIGKRGSSFPEQCNKNPDFTKGYNKGRIRYLEGELSTLKTKLKFERQSYERLRDDLQDTQFALNRLPRNSTLQSVIDERASLNAKINELQQARDKQRETIEKMEHDVLDIEKDITVLERFI